MLIKNKKIYWIILTAIVLAYSIIFVNFPNTFGQLIKEMSGDNNQTAAFFHSLDQTYNNVVIQFGFRTLGIIVSMWLTDILFIFFSKLEAKIHAVNFQKQDIHNLIYNLELFNLIVLLILAVATLTIGKSVQLVNNYLYLGVLFLGWIGKLVFVYIGFMKKTKLFITSGIGIILSLVIIGLGLL
ncbi:MAG: hypothetical protein LBC17_01050 [Lactobacillaceae bacterium]|jgi:hypothetical protein|nr:hypothetical protein [Lactobacillaceae bacterium]